MIGKIENGSLVTPTETERTKIVITRPTEDTLKFVYGYKDIRETEKPEYNQENQYLVEKYEETEDEIVVSYEVRDIEIIDISELM